MPEILTKIKNFVGWDNIDDEEFVKIECDEPKNISSSSSNLAKKNNKVVNIHTTAQLSVVVMTPENFEEAKDIADYLKNKSPVVINLEALEKEVTRRIVDFLSGAVYAVEGNIQRISNGIFLITPYNVSILGDFRDELRRGVLPWDKKK